MPKPFVPPSTRKHYGADRPVEVAHVRLETEIDLTAKTLRGKVTLSLRVRAPEASAIRLNAVDMEIRQVQIDGHSITAWDYDEKNIRIPLGKARSAGTELSVSVAYTARPRRGIYFIGPDETNPKRPLQCWTQGQDEDARFFVPCIDTPLEKATSEVICIAPAGKTFLSNGDLVSKEPAGPDRTRWHYRMDVPHSPYLLTLVCGDFTETTVRAPGTGVPIHYFAPVGREKDTERSLHRTPEMVDFFSRRIGIPYPYSRYSQIVVADFIFGGMENTTATTLTDQALVDERAALDHDVDSLVAHELAHQWWGDLVTCREWSEAWLNEGFATYFEYIWHEHARGRDEADVRLLEQMDGYFSESGEYQRPIVCRQYREPIELFDSHLYEKGGCILHMLRHAVGDDAFFAVLKLYGQRHARSTAETRDLMRAFEEVTGRNWDRFFDEWVKEAGHLELEGSWAWDDERGVGTLTLEQKQEFPLDGKAMACDACIRFEIDGKETDRTVEIGERHHTFELHLARKPTQVIFDPGNTVLKTLKLEKSVPLWTRQLEAASLGIDRLLAARALADRHEPAAIAALKKSLSSDRFWAVRAEAARSLGTLQRGETRDTLVAARTNDHPKVRRAVATGLGKNLGDTRAAEVLATWLKVGDPSCFVEAEAARALGKTRDPLAVQVLPGLLDRPAFQDVIRARAIEGLGTCGHDAAIDPVLGALQATASYQVRRAAVVALGRLGEGGPRSRLVRERLELALLDRHFGVRMDAAEALERLRDRAALPSLERALAQEIDGRTKRALNSVVSGLREGSSLPDELKTMRQQLEALHTESTRLRERLDSLEGKGISKAGPAGGGSSPEKHPPRPRPRAPSRRGPGRSSKLPRRRR